MTTINLLYIAFGPKDLFNQAIFSVLSFLRVSNDRQCVKIVIYTDDTKYFQKHLAGLPIAYEHLSKDAIENFLGPSRFIFRTKICIIQDCMSKYAGDLLYLDTDTFFTNDPAAIIEGLKVGHTYMHQYDFDLTEAFGFETMPWIKLRRMVRENEFTLRQEKVKFTYKDRMYNAGVVGIPKKYAYLLDDVLNLTDQVYQVSRFHTAEQFIFSYILEKNTSLKTSDQWIDHYWHLYKKEMYTFYIQRFLKEFKGAGMPKKIAASKDVIHDNLSFPKVWQQPFQTIWAKVRQRYKLVKQVFLTGTFPER